MKFKNLSNTEYRVRLYVKNVFVWLNVRGERLFLLLSKIYNRRKYYYWEDVQQFCLQDLNDTAFSELEHRIRWNASAYTCLWTSFFFLSLSLFPYLSHKSTNTHTNTHLYLLTYSLTHSPFLFKSSLLIYSVFFL